MIKFHTCCNLAFYCRIFNLSYYCRKEIKLHLSKTKEKASYLAILLIVFPKKKKNRKNSIIFKTSFPNYKSTPVNWKYSWCTPRFSPFTISWGRRSLRETFSLGSCFPYIYRRIQIILQLDCKNFIYCFQAKNWEALVFWYKWTLYAIIQLHNTSSKTKHHFHISISKLFQEHYRRFHLYL